MQAVAKENTQSSPTSSPALQLVSEIFESLKVKNVKGTGDASKEGPNSSSQSKGMNRSTSQDSQAPPVENFETLKSRLRKVPRSAESGSEKSPLHLPQLPDSNHSRDENEGESSNPTDPSPEDLKEKRSSTGSITNLKRMWEGQRGNGNVPNPTAETSEGTTKVTQQSKSVKEKTQPSDSSPFTNSNYNTNGNGSTERKGSSPSILSHQLNSTKELCRTPTKETKFQGMDNGNFPKPGKQFTKSQESLNSEPSPTNHWGAGGDKESAAQKTDTSKVKSKRVWPPPMSATDGPKPIVPVKPSMRKTNPIYATPSQTQRLENITKGKSSFFSESTMPV